MVKHIVLWNLKDRETVAATAAEIKRQLEALTGVVPGLHSAVVGVGFDGFDVALISEHDDRAALDAYQVHPAHCAVKEYIQKVAAERASCDFEQ